MKTPYYARNCTLCGLLLPVDQFSIYRASWCRHCDHRYNRIYNAYKSAQKHPPQSYALHKASYKWRRSPMWDAMYPPFEDDTEKKAA